MKLAKEINPEIEALWRKNRGRHRSWSDVTTYFPRYAAEVDREIKRLKLSKHIAFLVKAAIATDDQRLADAAVALAEHGLAGRGKKPLGAIFSARHPDGEERFILQVYATKMLSGCKEWEAIQFVAAQLGLESNSFKAAAADVYRVVRSRGQIKPDWKYAEIGLCELPDKDALTYLSRVNSEGYRARTAPLKEYSRLSSKNTPERKRGK